MADEFRKAVTALFGKSIQGELPSRWRHNAERIPATDSLILVRMSGGLRAVRSTVKDYGLFAVVLWHLNHQLAGVHQKPFCKSTVGPFSEALRLGG